MEQRYFPFGDVLLFRMLVRNGLAHVDYFGNVTGKDYYFSL